MPNKLIATLIDKLEAVDRQLQAHLSEGVGVKNDIVWIKWFIGLIVVAQIASWFKP